MITMETETEKKVVSQDIILFIKCMCVVYLIFSPVLVIYNRLLFKVPQISWNSRWTFTLISAALKPTVFK